MTFNMNYDRAAALDDLYKVNEEDIQSMLDEIEKKIEEEVKLGQSDLTITISDQREEYLMSKLVSAIERGGYKLEKEVREYKNIPNQYIYKITWVY